MPGRHNVAIDLRFAADAREWTAFLRMVARVILPGLFFR